MQADMDADLIGAVPARPRRSMAAPLRKLTQIEQLNFLLTNRIPRQALTRFAGWFSQIESRWLTRATIALWKVFADDLDLSEAEPQDYRTLHECFTRKLKPGMRTVDMRANIVSSPSDAIVGECGRVEDGRVYQAKGFPYELSELIPDPELQQKYRNGCYVTLRLKSSMYHRFHAPVDCAVSGIDYISGDTWNVNPIALKRVEKLYCKNERAVIQLHDTATAGSVCLVPVAAILVASMKFAGIDQPLNLKYRGPNRVPWQRSFAKGEEMGWFEHGSTIIVFATDNYALCEGIVPGTRIQMGQALLRDTAQSS